MRRADVAADAAVAGSAQRRLELAADLLDVEVVLDLDDLGPGAADRRAHLVGELGRGEDDLDVGAPRGCSRGRSRRRRRRGRAGRGRARRSPSGSPRCPRRRRTATILMRPPLLERRRTRRGRPRRSSRSRADRRGALVEDVREPRDGRDVLLGVRDGEPDDDAHGVVVRVPNATASASVTTARPLAEHVGPGRACASARPGAMTT